MQNANSSPSKIPSNTSPLEQTGNVKEMVNLWSKRISVLMENPLPLINEEESTLNTPKRIGTKNAFFKKEISKTNEETNEESITKGEKEDSQTPIPTSPMITPVIQRDEERKENVESIEAENKKPEEKMTTETTQEIPKMEEQLQFQYDEELSKNNEVENERKEESSDQEKEREYSSSGGEGSNTTLNSEIQEKKDIPKLQIIVEISSYEELMCVRWIII